MKWRKRKIRIRKLKESLINNWASVKKWKFNIRNNRIKKYSKSTKTSLQNYWAEWSLKLKKPMRKVYKKRAIFFRKNKYRKIPSAFKKLYKKRR